MILHQNYQKNSWSRIKLFGRVILLSKILQHASTIRKNKEFLYIKNKQNL